MKQYPSTPAFEDAPDQLFDRGHLWLLEAVDGCRLRFQLADSGLIRFGDEDRVFEGANDVPLHLRHATRHVRERLDRDALREAVDTVESITFVGIATTRSQVEYDWDRIPSFVGVDIWDAGAGAFRPPDAVPPIFETLGLAAVNDFEREVNARDFHPDVYRFPKSAWYDGPAAGVLVRNKRGDRAMRLNPVVCDGNSSERTAPTADIADLTAAEAAARYVDHARLRRVATTLEARSQAVTTDALYERTMEDIARETPGLFDGAVDGPAFRSAVAQRTRAFVEGHSSGG